MLRLLILFICIIIMLHNFRKKRLISSNSLWTLFYMMIFVIYPLFSDKRFDNEQLIDICAVLGIIFFLIGTFLGEKIKIRISKKKYIPSFKMARMGFWLILLILIILIINKLGIFGFREVIYGKTTAKELTLIKESSLGNIFIYLLNMLIPFVIVIWMKSDKKINKIFYLFIFLWISLLFLYTRLFVICTLLIIIFYELRYKTQKKQFLISVIGFSFLTFLMIFLNFFRNLGSEQIQNFWSYLNISFIFESTDFGASYKWFSELIKREPPFIIPITYLKPIFAFIPRTIWTTKPEPISLDILRNLNPELVSKGYSTAGNSVLGEGYAILGWSGIIIFPFIWGVICTYFDRKYYLRLKIKEDDSLWVICYYIFSTFIVVSCQRGDWSQYGIIIIWLFIFPLFMCSIKIKDFIGRRYE